MRTHKKTRSVVFVYGDVCSVVAPLILFFSRLTLFTDFPGEVMTRQDEGEEIKNTNVYGYTLSWGESIISIDKIIVSLVFCVSYNKFDEKMNVSNTS